MTSKGFHFNYSEFKKFERFVEAAGRNFSRMDAEAALNSALIESIKEFVKQEVRESFQKENGESHRFGEFMAARTQIEIVAQGQRYAIRISGMTEKELYRVDPNAARMTAKDLEGGKDYNLWAMYEAGEFDQASADPGTKSKKAQAKDVGGVLAIRTKSGDTTEFKGSYKGIVANAMDRIRSELKMRLQQAVLHYTKAMVAAALGDAAEKAGRSTQRAGTKGARVVKRQIGVERLPNQMRREVSEQRAKYEQDLAALGVRPVYYKQGSLQVRFQDVATGKFTSNVPTGFKERVIEILR